MTSERRFEKAVGGSTRYWEIRREGIRCTMGWGQVGGAGRASTMTLDDEAHAQRHLERKVREKLRQGYAEVGPAPDDPTPAGPEGPGPAASLLDVMRDEAEQRRAGAWAETWARMTLVDGYDDVYVSHFPFLGGPGPFREYLMLADEGRRGLTFSVKDPGHEPDAVETFLQLVGEHRQLAFDGRSHHKVPLPTPVRRFTHAVICSPSLNRGLAAGRLGKMFPIFDCEIGDADTETLVEARTKGRGSLPQSTWDREPHPVIDLRWDITSRDGEPIGNGGRPWVREPKFKVYTGAHLRNLPTLLATATAESFLEVRDARGTVTRVTPATYTPGTVAELERLVLVTAAPARPRRR